MLKYRKALLFDMDGTLIDSMGMWKDIDIEYLARYGKELPDDLQKCIEGMNFKETAVYMKHRFDIPDSVEKIMDDWNYMAEYKYSNEIEMKPGSIELLKWAKNNNIKLAISTSNSRFLVNALVKSKGIEDYFDYILTGDEIHKSKPNPDVYLTVAEKLGVDPSDCLVFEDIVAGIMAGKNAGMDVCAIEDNYSKGDREKKMAMSDFYLDSYLDIVYP